MLVRNYSINSNIIKAQSENTKDELLIIRTCIIRKQVGHSVCVVRIVQVSEMVSAVSEGHK